MKKFNDALLWLKSPHKTSTSVDRFRWNCANDSNPGIDEVPEWQDWSERGSTPDQKRIEAFLNSQVLSEKTLLHVGVGSSQLALNFHLRLSAIDGITIQEAELKKARELNIPNYRVFLLNKFSPEIPAILGRTYDFVVDNNPSSFSCCRKHFFIMLRNYSSLLNDNGLILTDKMGLGWSTQPNDPRWGLSRQDWFKIGARFGFRPAQFTDWVLGLEKTPQA